MGKAEELVLSCEGSRDDIGMEIVVLAVLTVAVAIADTEADA